MLCFFFFFQAKDGIRDARESRGLGDVYKKQASGGWQYVGHNYTSQAYGGWEYVGHNYTSHAYGGRDYVGHNYTRLLYTTDAEDELLCVYLCCPLIIK